MPMVASDSTNLTKKDLEEKLAKLETDIDDLLAAAAKRAEEMAKTPPHPPAPKPEPTVQSPPPPAEPATTQIHSNSAENTQKTRKEMHADYEKDYLERLANELKEKIEIERAAEELVAKRHAESHNEQVLTTRGTLPKGF